MQRSGTSRIQSVLAPDLFSPEERRRKKKTGGMLCETATTKTSTSCRAIFVMYKDHEYSLSLVIAAEEYWNIKGTLLTVSLMYSEAGEM